MIAFRGTDANEIGDWLTNLRWFIASPLFDQYDQVQKAVPDIIDKVNGEGCSPRLIVATGHSLGGGRRSMPPMPTSASPTSMPSTRRR